MKDINRFLDAHGGLLATAELRDAGVDRHDLRRLLAGQILWRARRGWYCRPGVTHPILGAIRVGGPLTCGPALRHHGVWAMDDGRLHVEVLANSSRLRSPRDSRERLGDDAATVLHYEHEREPTSEPVPDARLVVSVTRALSHYRRCVDERWYLAALDSALHRDPLSRDALRRAGHPAGLMGIDGVCESGTETLFWVAIRGLVPTVRRQHVVPGVGRVDFLIGDRLVVEIDSREFHDNPSGRTADRRRDLDLSRLGYRCLRFDYAQIVHELDRVIDAIVAAVSRGDHLR